MPKIYLPEARSRIVEVISATHIQWLGTLAKEMFDDPANPENMELLLEAQAKALSSFVAGREDGKAMIHTLALELLDEANK